MEVAAAEKQRGVEVSARKISVLIFLLSLIAAAAVAATIGLNIGVYKLVDLSDDAHVTMNNTNAAIVSALSTMATAQHTINHIHSAGTTTLLGVDRAASSISALTDPNNQLVTDAGNVVALVRGLMMNFSSSPAADPTAITNLWQETIVAVSRLADDLYILQSLQRK